MAEIEEFSLRGKALNQTNKSYTLNVIRDAQDL